MATIQIDIPTAAHAQRVLDAFAAVYSYDAFIQQPGGAIPNPETKAAFAKRKLAEYIKSVVRDYEARVAAQAASDAAIINANLLGIS